MDADLRHSHDFRSMPLLSTLEEAAFSAVMQSAVLHQVTRGDIIFHSGQPAEQFYVINSGSIKIFQYTPDGREQILYVYRSGDFVGGLNLLVSSDYLYTAEALESAEVLVIPKQSFDRYMYNQPAALRVILEQSFLRIRYAEALISRLGEKTAALKVAALLLRLRDDIGKPVKEGTLLELSMNREELGNYAGLTRESMTRMLNEFRQDGLIDWEDPQTMLIRDADGLLEMLTTM